MTTKKSLLVLFVFLFASLIYQWFFQIAPVTEFQDLVNRAPVAIGELASRYYAQDLVITVENGNLSLNRPSPYCFILEDNEKIGIVYDQKAVSSPEAFQENGPYQDLCRPVALFGPDFWMVPDTNSVYKVQKIPENFTFTVTNTDVDNFISTYLPKIIHYGTIAYWLLPFLMVLIVFSFLLLANLWYALVARFFVRIFKLAPSASYGELYNLCLFFYTILLFINWVVIETILNGALGQNLQVSFPFLNTILITLGAVLYYKSKPVSTVFTSTPAHSPKTKK